MQLVLDDEDIKYLKYVIENYKYEFFLDAYYDKPGAKGFLKKLEKFDDDFFEIDFSKKSELDLIGARAAEEWSAKEFEKLAKTSKENIKEIDELLQN